jgi:branched-chain amino acid transport system substrate-binding protein
MADEGRRQDARYTRKEVVKKAGAGAGGLIVAGSVAGAAAARPIRVTHEAVPEANQLRIGFLSPLSGPLGSFGEADPWVVSEFRKALKKGIKIGGKTYSVTIIAKDTQSDPARAGQLAKSLINGSKVDLMLSTSTPEVNNPIADACEAAGVPQVSTVQPWEAWYFGRGAKPGGKNPFKWTHHFSFGVADFAGAYISQWNRAVKTNKKVGALYPNDADGNAIRGAMIPILTKAGFTVIDAGPYEDGTTDFTAQITKFKQENCQIFNTFPLPPDFANFWRQAAQQGYTRQVKIAQIAKAGLFASEIVALGSLGYNLATAIYWGPTWPYRSLTLRMSNQQLSKAYTKATGRQWLQQLGATVAVFEVGLAALRASKSPKSKAAVARAFKTLVAPSPLGPVNFARGPIPGTVANGPIIGSQWVKTSGRFKVEARVTENHDDKKVPIAAQLKPYS